MASAGAHASGYFLELLLQVSLALGRATAGPHLCRRPFNAGRSGPVFFGVTAFLPWLLVHMRLGVHPPRVGSLFPSVLWKLCIEIPLTFRVSFSGDSVVLPDPQIGKSVVGPRTLARVRELLWYDCSPVLDSPPGGSMVEVMATSSKRTIASPAAPLRTAAARASVPKAGHCTFHWVLVTTRFCLCLPSISGRYEV